MALSLQSDALEPTRAELLGLSTGERIRRFLPVYGLPIIAVLPIALFSALFPDTFPTLANANALIDNKAIIALQARRPARHDPQGDGRDREVHRQALGRLARPGSNPDTRQPDLLTEAGVKYIGDWVYDDEPTTIRTANGPLVTLPYNFETHDIATMVLQHHESPYWVTKCRDTLDRYLQESSERTKIMAVALHPYIMGAPHRIGYLEQAYADINSREGVVHMNGAEILDWYTAQKAVGVPA